MAKSREKFSCCDRASGRDLFLSQFSVVSVSTMELQQMYNFHSFAGDSMKQASGEFAEDPCSSVKRGNMVRAARALLSAVTHLLVLADMSDVYKLLLQLKLVRR